MHKIAALVGMLEKLSATRDQLVAVTATQNVQLQINDVDRMLADIMDNIRIPSEISSTG